jgi:hypothetical protein
MGPSITIVLSTFQPVDRFAEDLISAAVGGYINVVMFNLLQPEVIIRRTQELMCARY